MALHKDLTGTELHENKGVASAAADDVATANGSGVTVWKKITSANLDASLLLNNVILTTTLDDIGTASTTWLVAPYAGTVDWASIVLHGAITGADSTLTFKNASGVTMATLLVPFSGSSAGYVDTQDVFVNNTFAVDTPMSIATDGLATGPTKVTITIGFTAT
jgi:hypothetical protein